MNRWNKTKNYFLIKSAGVLFALTIFFTIMFFVENSKYIPFLAIFITGIACGYTIKRILKKRR
jgi:hypothetical protein